MRARPITIPSAIGHRAAGEAGAGAAGDERDAAVVAYPHRGLHLAVVRGRTTACGHGAVAGEAVALVGAHLRSLRDDRTGTDRALEFGDEASCA